MKKQLASFCNQKSSGQSMANKTHLFFLNLEKRNYLNKCITQLNINGNIISDRVQILNEERKFYEKLYAEPDEDDPHHQTKTQDIRIIFLNEKYPKLATSERMKYELAINEHTCAGAVSKLKKKVKPQK